jgi:hypothetical protein
VQKGTVLWVQYDGYHEESTGLGLLLRALPALVDAAGQAGPVRPLQITLLEQT